MIKKFMVSLAMLSLLSLGFSQLLVAKDSAPVVERAWGGGTERYFEYYATAAKVNMVGYLLFSCHGTIYSSGTRTEFYTLEISDCP